MAQQIREHPLLERGLGFIGKALARLNDGNAVEDLEYALIYVNVGIELVFKQPLVDEHWALAIQDVNLANMQNYNRGAFSSVDFPTAIKRLSKICRIEVNQAPLDTLRERRNRLMHFGILDEADKEAILSEFADARMPYLA